MKCLRVNLFAITTIVFYVIACTSQRKVAVSSDQKVQSTNPSKKLSSFKPGQLWYDDKNAFILKLPSAIITDEYNYVIKTTSSHIDRIRIIANKPFLPDERLEHLLKSVDTRKLKSA